MLRIPIAFGLLFSSLCISISIPAAEGNKDSSDNVTTKDSIDSTDEQDEEEPQSTANNPTDTNETEQAPQSKESTTPTSPSTTKDLTTSNQHGVVHENENDDEDDDEDGSTEPDFSAEAQIDIVNRLIWRGIAFTKNSLLEPSASVLAYGFTAEYWSAYTLTSELGNRRLAALVPSLSYEATFGRMYASPGVIYYAVSPDGLRPTMEGTLEGGYKAGEYKVFSENMLDIAQYRGAYFGFFGTSVEHQLLPNVQVQARLNLGIANAKFNEVYLNDHRAAFDMVGASMAVRYNPIDWLYLLPHLEISSLLMLRDRVTQPTLISAGCALGAEY